MSELLNRFSYEAIKFNGQVFACAFILWLAVLVCAYSSILAQPYTRQQRIFWIVMVTGLPLLGLLIYLPFSFRKEDMPHIFLTRPRKKKPTATFSTSK